MHDGAGGQRFRGLGVLVHQMGEEFSIERTPIDADAHWLAMLHRHIDDGAELLDFLVLETDVAGVDAIFVERFGAVRIFAEQLVADVMEIADQRHGHAALA